MVGFADVLVYKSPKTPFFALKYLTRYTHETFFERYMKFEAHYLSRCRDIPLQSFGSHIRPQPHGLGLREIYQKIPLSAKQISLDSPFIVLELYLGKFFVREMLFGAIFQSKRKHMHLNLMAFFVFSALRRVTIVR
jgi:hypothetical protein